MVVIATYIDAETGEEIITWIQPERTVTMVRDAKTKRFIRLWRKEELKPGEELITIKYPARTVTMVRDAETKRFIRGIKGITVAVALVFDYPPERAKRANPLYVDVKSATFVIGEDLKKMDDIEKELAGKCKDVMTYMFGEYLAPLAEESPPEHYDGVPPKDKMPKETCLKRVVGVEYISVPIAEVYPDYHWWAIWHHYKDDCQEEDGSARI